MEKKNWKAGFTVENLTSEEVDGLIDVILDYIVPLGGQMGGGFGRAPETWDEIINEAVEDLKLAIRLQMADEEEE